MEIGKIIYNKAHIITALLFKKGLGNIMLAHSQNFMKARGGVEKQWLI